MNPENVLITGGTGLIGTRLTKLLVEQGANVAYLSRSTDKGSVKSYFWNPAVREIDRAALNDATAIVHLAGSGIADKPWTKSQKKKILDSRVDSSALLYQTLKESPHNVKVVVAASGVNYYGFDRDGKLFTETDQPGNDFLADVVVQWEREVDKIAQLGVRVVKMRTGFVLSPEGGALKELARPVKLGVGAAIGSGQQRVSWIHIDDLCAMFIKAIKDDNLRGAYNAGGPYPVTNKDLTKAIAATLNKPLWLPNVPAFAIKLLLGEMSDLVLKGTSVSSERIQKEGFTYKFDTIEKALKDLYVQ